MTLTQEVTRYVRFMQKLGYQYIGRERMLQNWATYAMAHGDGFARTDRMIHWVAQASSSGSMRNRFGAVRRLAIWLHAEDPRHEIPPRSAIGRAHRSRPAPHLLTPKQIRQVMDAALTRSPAGSITPQTYHTLIGLLASTGLRASEACALQVGDWVPDGLIIRETKFRKSRLVALHESTRMALEGYLKIREAQGGPGEGLFVLATGKPPTRSTLTHVFIQLVRQCGLRGGPGEPGPRLHDLRHAFAVRSIESAIATNRDRVNRHMLALGTYLGHANPYSTYWYLEATPVLLRHIAVCTENRQVRRVG